MMADMVTIVSSLVFLPLDLLFFDLVTATKRRKAMSIFRKMKLEVIAVGVRLSHCHAEGPGTELCAGMPLLGFRQAG